MRPFIPLTTFALLAPAALATYLPACSSTSSTPCSCPPGTSYAESVTFAAIGAKATDVKALIGDFFRPAWLGVVPFATQGQDNQPGALRSATVPTAIGIYNFTEKAGLPFLTRFHSERSGSFIQKFELLDSLVPLEFRSGNGSFSGYWITLQSSSIFQYETAIRWSVYACSTGKPQNYALFHEAALANATRVLQEEGKVRGSNLTPVSIQSF